MTQTSITVGSMFAGIGGIDLGFTNAGFTIKWANEIDNKSCKTYSENFDHKMMCGDVADLKTVPKVDVITAGFPCQPFSIAGRKMGFNDNRGVLFWEISRIIKAVRPKAFLLENVKNLKTHDHGKTFDTICNILENELGYRIFSKILNAKNFGVPQNRERLVIVGFRKNIKIDHFEFPDSKNNNVKLKDVLEKNVLLNFFISKKRYIGMKRHKKRHEDKGHGFGYRILDNNGISGTIVLGGMGKERNLVIDKTSFRKLKNTPGIESKTEDAVRYLTPREYARLQGFSDNYKIPVANIWGYRQFANSVPVPMIKAVAREMKNLLCV
ncbi:MAG: DNA-cytosine methyltransferase [Cenarchaeum symbiont of Oopsacas minuta]|nr:DNA-cytosine methyltransferase [Cenarchaeum symbiont of Oopsacas minuta]